MSNDVAFRGGASEAGSQVRLFHPALVVLLLAGCDPGSTTAVAVPVASVVITPNGGSIQVGGTIQLTAVPYDASGGALAGRVVSWASGNAAKGVST